MYKSNFIKKRPQYRCFPVNFAKFFKNIFCYRTPLVAASVGEIKESRASNVSNNPISMKTRN